MSLMTEDEKWQKRALSRHQLATLRFILQNQVLLEHLGQAQQNTLGSLLQRHYIGRQGEHIVLTAAGEQALKAYEEQNWRMREHAGPITSRVEGLLKYAKIHMVRKSAA